MMDENELRTWQTALGGTHVHSVKFGSADSSTAFHLICVDAEPSRWLLRQDGAIVASGIAATPETARDEAVIAAKGILGHDFISVIE